MKETTKINLKNHAMNDQARQNNAVSKSGSNGVLCTNLEINNAARNIANIAMQQAEPGPSPFIPWEPIAIYIERNFKLMKKSA